MPASFESSPRAVQVVCGEPERDGAVGELQWIAGRLRVGTDAAGAGTGDQGLHLRHHGLNDQIDAVGVGMEVVEGVAVLVVEDAVEEERVEIDPELRGEAGEDRFEVVDQRRAVVAAAAREEAVGAGEQDVGAGAVEDLEDAAEIGLDLSERAVLERVVGAELDDGRVGNVAGGDLRLEMGEPLVGAIAARRVVGHVDRPAEVPKRPFELEGEGLIPVAVVPAAPLGVGEAVAEHHELKAASADRRDDVVVDPVEADRPVAGHQSRRVERDPVPMDSVHGARLVGGRGPIRLAEAPPDRRTERPTTSA